MRFRSSQPYMPVQGRWPARNSLLLRWILGLAGTCIIVAAAAQQNLPAWTSASAGYMTNALASDLDRNTAMQAMRQAMTLLAHAGHAQPSSDDPNRTGLIGVEWSDITSTLGDLEAKRTALSPLWAAVVVNELKASGVKAGDVVAVSLSGSFPGLNIAVLAAAKTLQLRVRAVVSPTASMYGANRIDWTWTDMMAALAAAGWLENIEWAVTPGAGNDLGEGLLTDSQGASPITIKAILKAILQRSGAPLLKGATLAEMIDTRWSYYHQAGQVSVFVNVGGGHATTGGCPPPANRHGRLLSEWTCKGMPGLLWRFRHAGVPTLHFLNIKELALRYGIPLDPVPLPGWNDVAASVQIGSGRL